MEIELLGGVTVSAHGHARTIRALKVRTMLATLALEPGRAVSRGALADELWNGQPLGNLGNALQANATRLRKIIDGPEEHQAGRTRLLAVANGYQLDVTPADVDVWRFRDLAVRGAELAPRDPGGALELLQRALELWRGPALLDAGDGLRCRSAAARLEERRLSVWEHVHDARIALGDYGRAIAELHQLVARYPLRERFAEQLMLALYRGGRQCDALALYQQTRRRLDDELGVQPGRSLRRRHAAILAQDPVLMSRAAIWADPTGILTAT